MYKYNNDEDSIAVVIVIVVGVVVIAEYGGSLMAWRLCQLQLVYYLNHARGVAIWATRGGNQW